MKFKLKALKPRLHNIMFHTHTVSGIVISFALFIIFYCGAFSLFLEEMHPWEDPAARISSSEIGLVDYNKAFEAFAEAYPNLDKDKAIRVYPSKKYHPQLHAGGFLLEKDGKSEYKRVEIDPVTYEIAESKGAKVTMASTIYRLHFFSQIPYVGLYLSGLTAFFFLFAVITGLLTHWKNLRNKFYAFTTSGKWKQIWTNGHLSLGFLTLPFQVIYAVTGALLGLSLLLLAPSAFILFDGDTEKIISLIDPERNLTYHEASDEINAVFNFNDAYAETQKQYPEHDIFLMTSRNYGKEDGTIAVRLDDGKKIAGDGNLIFSQNTGEIVQQIKPSEKNYTQATYGILIKLHYATFGGIFLKIIYFILAMITCYVIISGVMIWRTAREKDKKYTDKQKRFHHRVTKFYLAICLSLFPAVALIFLANKLVPYEMTGRTFYVNTVFFVGWLVLTLIGLFWNNYRQLNRNYLIIGSVMGLCVPIANGLVTGDWFWKTIASGQYAVFAVDVTWIMTGVFGLVTSLIYLRRNVKSPITEKAVRFKSKP
ncbi:MAG: PepSY-associated TM helix domain-containing protein, partial [Bacteroidota bacterium]